MNIDWRKAPEGATHYNCSNQFFYKFKPVARFWSETDKDWAIAASSTPTAYEGDEWIIKADQAEKTRQEIIDLAANRCGIAGDSIRQLATVLAAEGYRKFEIVEEDV